MERVPLEESSYSEETRPHKGREYSLLRNVNIGAPPPRGKGRPPLFAALADKHLCSTRFSTRSRSRRSWIRKLLRRSPPFFFEDRGIKAELGTRDGWPSDFSPFVYGVLLWGGWTKGEQAVGRRICW